MVTSLYEQVGGDSFFVQLVNAFYDEVEKNPTLRPMYPDDLSDSRRHLTLFLIQYWGGPKTYQEERGHPRLRMRHVPFRVNKSASSAWLSAMEEALSSVRDQLSDERFDELHAYFVMVTAQLRNA